jgi:hypothetical protein
MQVSPLPLNAQTLPPCGYHLFGNAKEKSVIKTPISQDVKKAVQT